MGIVGQNLQSETLGDVSRTGANFTDTDDAERGSVNFIPHQIFACEAGFGPELSIGLNHSFDHS
ncbi:hypothetical protein D3C73_1622490 [compost metagenome]